MEQETEVWKPKVVWKHAFYHFLLHIALIYGIVLIASSRISLWTGLWGKLFRVSNTKVCDILTSLKHSPFMESVESGLA